MKFKIVVEIHSNDIIRFTKEQEAIDFITSALVNYDIKVLEIQQLAK